MIEDRTVHAEDSRGIQIVRYDRAGKWYVEVPENYGRFGLPAERVHVTVADAAYQAKEWLRRGDGVVYLGRHGGRTFDRLVA